MHAKNHFSDTLIPFAELLQLGCLLIFHCSTSAETMTATLNDEPPPISQLVQASLQACSAWCIAAWKKILNSIFTLHRIFL
jgi:hypothetical protein